MKVNYKVILRWLYIGAALVVLFVAIGFCMHAHQEGLLKQRAKELAGKGGGVLVEAKPAVGQIKNPEAKRLIVVVHGYAGNGSSMRDVIKATQINRADSGVVLMEYPADPLSNADCTKISKEICDRIAERSAKYEDITLVGYSMGALLARKAYVYGWGRTEDLGERDAAIKRLEKQEWVNKVKRFVLLAGMNRGWSTATRPKGMPWWKQMAYRAGVSIAEATGTGRLIRDCQRGAPFVANLRMQWLDVMNNEFKDERAKAPATEDVPTGAPEATLTKKDQPTVIQLLGSDDDIVSEDDSRDASVSKGFVWVQLSDTRHENAADFTCEKGKTQDKEEAAKARGDWFVKALGDETAIERLRRMSPETPPQDDLGITKAVIVLHGIRDYGFWTADFFSPLQESFLNDSRNKGKLLVYRPSYGYFPMGSFLLPIERQQKVRWFMDEVTELKAKYPKLETIHFVGHSNGTYVLAHALTDYKALTVGRVVLAGSVLPKHFDWVAPSLRGRVEKVHNFVATADWVVAFFPHLFEIPPFTLFHNEIGEAGHRGFELPKSAEKDPGKAAAWKSMVSQTWNVKGGHGAALGKEGIDAMKPFLLAGEPIVKNPNPGPRSWVVALFGYVPWLVWLAILAVLLVLGRLWYKAVSKLFQFALKPTAAKVAAVITYCALILFLLETV